MKNLDALEQEKAGIVQEMQDAITGNDTAAFSAAFAKFTDHIAQRVTAQAEAQQQGNDVQVLASRGARQLTSEEKNYFQKLGDAMKSPNPKQALEELDVVMPKTTIDAIFEDLTTSHPLLEVVDFQNTSGLMEMLINTNEGQLGTWGPLTAKIVEELTSGFKKVNMSLAKYSAFLPVAKSMLDLGPAWLETYARTVLQETIYLGLEEAIVKGTGKDDSPIGMIRQVGEGVTVTGGEYPEKTPIPVTSLDPVTYGKILSGMVVTPNGNQRTIERVIMVVSPVDYCSKIMPATTFRTAYGPYADNVLPFPTKIIQSVHVAAGRMILGLPKRYIMGIGTGKSGKIEYSDHARFLEDERLYICKLYGHGEPKDNNAFVYCDISGLEPAIQEIRVVEKAASASADIETP